MRSVSTSCSGELVVTTIESSEPWKVLVEILSAESPADIEQFLGQLPDADLPITLSRLSVDDQKRLMALLPAERGADLLDYLPDLQALTLIENLEPHQAAAIIDELPSNEQADLIGELNERDANIILGHMAPADAKTARRLSQYEDDEAGGLMITEFLRYPETATVATVLEDMRRNAEVYRDYEVQYAYICDDRKRLTGVLRLRDLLLAAHNTRVDRLMIRDPISVLDTTSVEELDDLFEHHAYLGVPVVGTQQELVGVVRAAAVSEAMADRQDSDLLKMQGIVGGEELRSMPVLLRSRRRLTWLSINIVLNVIAASVIAMFQDTLQAVIILAVFLPIISDMSGCSGNQAVAVSIRELALGLIRPNEVWRVFLKEGALGMINGIVLGILLGTVAGLWQQNIWLAFVVGTALALNTMLSVLLGGLVPLVMKRLQVDPALASGPVLTTVTDMCGFFLVLSFASAMLDRL
jgi:magnesium transporter